MDATNLKQWIKGFPGWRLGSKLKDASDERLESSGGACVRWEYGCGALVILAVAVEILIAAIHPKYDSWLMRWGSAICDLAIALGVAGEILFSSRSHNFSSELTRRANDRLARLKDATAWRAVGNAERIPIAEALKASGTPASVQFHVLANDPESFNYAAQLGTAFKVAGWKVGYSFESYRHAIPLGIMLPTESVSWTDRMGEANRRVRNAFIAANLPFLNGWPADTYMQTGGGEPLSEPIAWVYVGPKPMPLE